MEVWFKKVMAIGARPNTYSIYLLPLRKYKNNTDLKGVSTK
jgi:hypothetical protein